MPWNDNSNAGGKPGSKKPSPWGDTPSGGDGGGTPPPSGPRRRPPGGGPTPPDFNDLTRRFAQRLEGAFGGGGRGDDGGSGAPRRIGGGAVAIGLSVIFLLWAMSGVFMVRPNQIAVIKTFGAFSRSYGPGLKYHAPWPIESAKLVNVTDLRTQPIGGTQPNGAPNESLMLTGDENIVDIRFTVLWKVKDARDYLFNLDNPDAAVKAVAESAMREVIGRNALTPIITTARGNIQVQVAHLMQTVLDSYGAGVSIQEVQITDAVPPPQVVDAFREVQSANQYAEAAKNTAQGQAAQNIQQALGYKAQAIQEAQGEAAAFNQVYQQYKLAPAVTRQRLYIETMQRVLQSSRRIIVDNKSTSAPIILPPDAFRPNPALPSSSTPTAPRASSGGSQ